MGGGYELAQHVTGLAIMITTDHRHVVLVVALGRKSIGDH